METDISCKRYIILEKTQISFCSTRCTTGRRVLGIETSCDDTGAAVVDEYGNILGNALQSQTQETVAVGGVIPFHARDLHKAHIEDVVEQALKEANVTVKDLDAVAVTVKPGISMCLNVGLSYAKKLVQEHRVPMIPIHHMEAHALTARMIEQIDFPFLVLLVSGGHCLLAVAKDIDQFLLLGTALDSSPGEAFDKVARRMKLKNLPECYNMSGGAMVEHIAKQGDIEKFPPLEILSGNRSCNFSFSGMKTHYMRLIENKEKEQEIVASNVISNAGDVCASFQYSVVRHLAKPLHRAFLFSEMRELLPEDGKTLVVSGGVACNQYIQQGLKKVCEKYDCRLVCPPPHLCTDNGIMIAWNGIEKLKAGRGFAEDPQSQRFIPKVPFGEDLTLDVANCTIKVRNANLL
ncbi:tRNA N6-adenosine threonylcarbamoyltransferase, mitochondrial-like [Ruditapes philippinarum]|uniref:tRNA N6-adenosine threonylcarbamoyltransferase, mitochondrial-like n=1 Tax=Ruditapes philippinarum TaxID=129788 RepID=UPI00295AE707|nr:tRNA N6-adenosine threonylcarbamoyltransferase, mitochondrial-like [Ruditapes philippinarum]